MKFRLLKIYIYARNFFRINHWRGHGIHSPFMYRLVREVLVKKRVSYNPHTLPENIINYNLLKRDTLLIRNLYSFLQYPDSVIVGEGEPGNRTFCVAPMDASPEAIRQTIEMIRSRRYNECCVAVLGVNKSLEKYQLCRRLIQTEGCVCVDLYRTYLFLFDHRLQKQYYRIRSRYGDPILNSIPVRLTKNV